MAIVDPATRSPAHIRPSSWADVIIIRCPLQIASSDFPLSTGPSGNCRTIRSCKPYLPLLCDILDPAVLLGNRKINPLPASVFQIGGTGSGVGSHLPGAPWICECPQASPASPPWSYFRCPQRPVYRGLPAQGETRLPRSPGDIFGLALVSV
jgi:hypothetical protein